MHACAQGVWEYTAQRGDIKRSGGVLTCADYCSPELETEMETTVLSHRLLVSKGLWTP